MSTSRWKRQATHEHKAQDHAREGRDRQVVDPCSRRVQKSHACQEEKKKESDCSGEKNSGKKEKKEEKKTTQLTLLPLSGQEKKTVKTKGVGQERK